MSHYQSKIISFVSTVLALFGLFAVTCVSQGIPLKSSERIGVTTMVPVIPDDAPVNIESDLELACTGSSCNIPENVLVLPEVNIVEKIPAKVAAVAPVVEAPKVPEVIRVPYVTRESFESIRPGAARRRPATVSKERVSARVDRSSVTVPGGAVWASDKALAYDPMNGEL